MNANIRVPEVLLIDQDGNQIGVIPTAEALERAQQAGLDLVEVSPNVKPPVCRILNYGKYLFELSKRKATQKKKQKLAQMKEVKFRPATDIGDFQVKLRKINDFLTRGDKVKISVRFRGREVQHKDLGLELLDRIKKELPEGYLVEQEVRMEGKQITFVTTLPTGKRKPEPTEGK